MSKNENISLLELIQIFSEFRNNIIININKIQENYQRIGIKRVEGIRDENGEILKPWLQTEYIDNGQYVDMGQFEISRNTATINMLIKRRVKLAKVEDQTPIIEVAGLLANDLNRFNNYTIVSDGVIHIKSLQVKISSRKLFDLLKEKGVIDADKFDFCAEYTINLDNLPLIPVNRSYTKIDGLFSELAAIKVLSSIISAHLKGESDSFVTAQMDDLKNHYISNNLYINFPTSHEYTNLEAALANGSVEVRTRYKIDIGSTDILNLSKLYSANKFLERMYQVYDQETGEIFIKPSLAIAFNQNIAFRHKNLSSRIKITPVDEFMQAIFDNFLGIEENGVVSAILTKVGADSLAQVLQAKRNGQQISKEDMVAVLTEANMKLKQYTEQIYRDKISPLVFYIGVTGNLPDEMEAQAMNAEEVTSKYPNLQLSKHERAGEFFAVGDSLISVYPQTEYYSKKVVVGIED